jgi:hypothetical protein
LLSDLGFFVPFAEDLPASPLCRDWEDYVSSMLEARLGVPVSSELIDLVSFCSQRGFLRSLGGGLSGEPSLQR